MSSGVKVKIHIIAHYSRQTGQMGTNNMQSGTDFILG